MSLPPIPEFPTNDVDLLGDVNGNPYNGTTNPDGLADGGHRQNWSPAMNAMAAVATWVKDTVAYLTALASQVAADAASAAAGSGTEATVAAIRSGINAFFLSIRRVHDANVPVALTDASTISWDLSSGINFDLTISAAGRTMANPTGKIAGKSGLLAIIQGSGGGKTITTWGSDFEWFGDKPSWPAAAGAISLVSYVVRPDGKVWLNYGGNRE